MLKQKQPGSPYRRASNLDVFQALKKHYKEMATGKVRTAAAQRAADLWQEEVEAQPNPDHAYSYVLGDVLMDAGRYDDAAGAFEQAAAAAKEPQQVAHFTLLAARAQFKAILEAGDKMPRPERIKALEKTRQLFTDFLIQDAAKRDGLLKKLADPNAWPSKEEWDEVKRRPEELLTAAEVYAETSPPGGLDGRWIGVRLILHQQSFTKPRPDPANPPLDEFIPFWWEGAELMLKLYVSIAESGGEPAKAAKAKGSAFATMLSVQYPDMDGPERVERIRVLAGRLK
jgi:tetratricopeptide (TPR) repeat protein